MSERRTDEGRPIDGSLVPTRYLLRLFVAGSSPASLRAIHNATSLCERRLAGRADLKVIDLRLHPEQARAANVVAMPVLVRERPGPPRRVIGDLADAERVILALGIEPAEDG